MNSTKLPYTSQIIAHALRLTPGKDLYQEIKTYIQAHNIEAGFIMTCVGSLQQTNIRLANADAFMKSNEHYEITSLVGCISCKDRMHLHISIADSKGNAFGGHLCDKGNLIFTTAEIIIGELPSLIFTKEKDNESGWDELKINKK